VKRGRDWLEIAADWIEGLGLGPELSALVAQLAVLVAIAVLSLIANFVAKKLILGWAKFFAGRTQNDWDDIAIRHGVFHQLAHLAPAVIVYLLLPVALPDTSTLLRALRRLVLTYMVVVGTLAVDAALSVVVEVYERLPIARVRPIKTYVQVMKIALFMVMAIIAMAILLGRSPWGFLTGLGAMTAVLLLVFKDTILGFVASVQLIANDMVRRGDWIEVPKFGADGDVIDISVATVKVQNWDKTISMIPTYALITESFKNWRGMSESGGRRIKRAIYIDMNSIGLCSEQQLDRFERITLIAEYVRTLRREIGDYNAAHKLDMREVVNGRRMTNLGTFRAYVAAYLRQHPHVNKEMTMLVRHLAPDANGMPLEVYVFCKDKTWAVYERVQADIFDHLLAVLPEFGLRVFQSPGGADVRLALEGAPATPEPAPQSPS